MMLREQSANNIVLAAVLFLAVIPVAVGQTGVVRGAALAHSVADAMGLTGTAVNPDQIEFLAGGSNIREGAEVRVLKVTNRTDGTLKVELRCQDNHACLPFYVLVHGLDPVNLTVPEKRSQPVSAASVPQSLIRGGDHATLILESRDSRISMPVICLQSGVRGQTIRVASTDRKQVFDAEIVATGMLKGNL
jgi:Chaperone for flagella basal body P-ring formation